MSLSREQRAYAKYKRRHLPEQLERARRRLAHLRLEVVRYGLGDLLAEDERGSGV